ncbi:hypothetical protein FUSO5_09670 [Fusobacterium necrophorum BFTR-1]|uniref:CatB-related O-acetyltransferase n=1 Tax=Fusobacterium necrophorum TaxID=859 RepID=UPI000460FE0A|nr:CatB-related O-acetyltransferase [Fusobacterium necrophorum]KDE62463.1 hypothetical protein FUSO5_09670 [Fusobacterium necrophorum BFTR-1]MCF0161647.1 CatB-related O-acetyltransferase [Fusobacterium necrophorum]
MLKLEYYISKVLKKLKGRAIKNSFIDKTSKVEAGSTILNTSFGKHSYCGYNCTIINTEIGNFCSISDNVLIGQASHSMEWVSTSPVFREGKDSVKAKFAFFPLEEPKKIIIGNDVWIGEGVKIKSGIKIGNGVVIGMGSVVTRDLEDYGVYAGNPAKLLRKRFSSGLIKELNKIKWWNFDDNDLKKYGKYFNIPSLLVKEYKK